MKRIDHPKSNQYKDVFSRTYYVSNEHSEQTEKFSKILKDTFENKSGDLFAGVIGGVDPFMNFAININCESFLGIDINPVAVEVIEARMNLAEQSVTGESYLQDLFGANLEELNTLITEELPIAYGKDVEKKITKQKSQGITIINLKDAFNESRS